VTVAPGVAPTHAVNLESHCMPHRPPPRCAAGCLLSLIDEPDTRAVAVIVAAELATLADARTAVTVTVAIRRVRMLAAVHQGVRTVVRRVRMLTLVLAAATGCLLELLRPRVVVGGLSLLSLLCIVDGIIMLGAVPQRVSCRVVVSLVRAFVKLVSLL
jgi:hypothetical protein